MTTPVMSQDLKHFVQSVVPTGITAVLQFAIFAITARALGPELFGLLVVIYGAAAIAVEFAGFGGDEVIVKHTASDRSRYALSVGHALILLMIAAPIVMLIAIFLATRLVPDISVLAIALIVVSDICFQRAMAMSEKIMIAHQHPVRASIVRMVSISTRAIVAALIFVFAGVATIEPWAIAIFIQSALVCGILAVGIGLTYGRPTLKLDRDEVGFGALMMINQVSRNLQANLDRILLAPVLVASSLGIYAASTRLLMIGAILNQTATRIFYPKFFIAVEDGQPSLRSLTFTSAKAMLAIGAMSSVLIAVAAQILPLILGPDFAEVSRLSVIIGLCSPFVALQYPAADALTVTGHQLARTIIYLVGAFLFSLGLVAGTLVSGIWGAAVMYVIGHAGLCLALWIAALARAINPASTVERA